MQALYSAHSGSQRQKSEQVSAVLDLSHPTVYTCIKRIVVSTLATQLEVVVHIVNA